MGPLRMNKFALKQLRFFCYTLSLLWLFTIEYKNDNEYKKIMYLIRWPTERFFYLL